VEGEVQRDDVPEMARLRTLEEENRRLKKHLAEQMLDNAVLKALSGKIEDDALSISPEIEVTTNGFAALIGADRLRITTVSAMIR